MKMFKLIALLSCLYCLPLCRTMAQVQGTDFPANSPISDQKPGSVLVFPLYSSTANGIAENTRIAITNLGAATAYLRLYLVNGGSGQVNSFQDCLIANQTHSFTASDVDPMVRGFIVVVAVGTDGKPVKYNFLAGEEDIKLASGHRGSLKATAISALVDNPGAQVGGLSLVQFDDVHYNRLPRTIAANKLKSLGEGNQPLLVLVSIAGSYNSTVSSLGTYNGSLIGRGGVSFQASFSLTQNSPQLVQALSASYPPTNPNYSNLIPHGATGWLKLWRSDDAGLLGAVFNYNAQSGATANTSGHNLRVLTLAGYERISILIQPSVC